MVKTIETGLDNNPVRLLGESIMNYTERFMQPPYAERTNKISGEREMFGSVFYAAVSNTIASLFYFH